MNVWDVTAWIWLLLAVLYMFVAKDLAAGTGAIACGFCCAILSKMEKPK